MLSVKQTADLMGISERGVRWLITEGKLLAEVSFTAQNKPAYQISITALDPKLQQRYYNELAGELAPAAPVEKVSRALEEYSAEDREQIAMWSKLLIEWQGYRNNPAVKSKTGVDTQFIAMLKLRNPELNLSEGTLYRKWTAYKEGDLDGLIDKRGQWRSGQYEMHQEIWDTFRWYFYDQRQLPISICVKLAEDWVKENMPELLEQFPSYHAFRRRTLNEPKALITMGRKGMKAWEDRCAPFVIRDYSELESNDYWIADNHTIDVITQGEDGQNHRLYITAFIDARSGIMTGWFVTDSPSSDSTLLALRHGILRCGVPRAILVDNGREFLNKDIGGLGHRQKKSTKGEQLPPPIFERLGIKMVNSIVRNAKAKPIERTFGTFKNTVSRLFPTFTGGNVLEKPANLKQRIKQGVPHDKELQEYVESIIDGVYNMGEYNGPVVADHGKSRIEVFNEYLQTKRVAKADDLTLLLMRTTRPQQIGRNGVFITIHGEKIFYFNEWTYMHQSRDKDEQVYVRYDPADLREVRIYDARDDRFLTTAPLNKEFMLAFGGATKEEIGEAQRIKHKLKKATQLMLENERSQTCDQRIDALARMAKMGNASKKEMVISNGKVLEIVRADEKQPQAVNGEGSVLAIDREKLHRTNLQKLREVLGHD